MNRIIGFDRTVKLDWLDATVAQCQSHADPKTVARNLDQQLANEIAGDKARRNTVTVLMRVWLKVPAEERGIRDEGLILATEITPDERLWLHWGMSLLAYPFFRDVAATVGQLAHLQGVVSHAQVQRRMIEGWGQRSTLERAVQRLVRTFIDWEVLTETDVRGSYSLAPPQETSNRGLALWLLDAALHSHAADQIPLTELVQLPYTFPFDMALSLSEVRRSDRFEVTRQGLDLEMISPAEREIQP